MASQAFHSGYITELSNNSHILSFKGLVSPRKCTVLLYKRLSNCIRGASHKMYIKTVKISAFDYFVYILYKEKVLLKHFLANKNARYF
jgi:hypothetical protein